MCETSKTPAPVRTATCSWRMPSYCTGISQPANGTSLAPAASWRSYSGVRRSVSVAGGKAFSLGDIDCARGPAQEQPVLALLQRLHEGARRSLPAERRPDRRSNDGGAGPAAPPQGRQEREGARG